ncbi:constitutive coactivator of peroxisome proliferator-activated receptor gamma-like [Diadema antillarum]|uniref:constitutive coactivator of peroxisome proliferator-activated receptor gamma-like n=1 Tax=Diadema antillarum TaxID=105358 RepID=UPI003A8BDBE3
MGVRGLLSFVERQCPEAFVDVNLRRLADHYRRTHNARPVLLFDCNNFIRNIYGDLEYAYGGQWVQYIENLKHLLAAFQGAGFDLVIIFDAVIEKKKLKVWVDRRKNERKLVSKIFAEIKCSGKHPPHQLLHIPPGLSSFTSQALKSLGASVYFSTMEVDREFYLYCKKHKCFGIAGRDTDFMIYDFPQFLFMKCYRGKIQRIQQFRKDVLCQYLGLPPQHLPLLACLVGNDTVPPERLSEFHNWVTRGGRDPLIPCVAGFINSLQLRDLSAHSLNWVASQVGQFLGDGYLYECVQDYTCQWQDYGPAQARPGAQQPHVEMGEAHSADTCGHSTQVDESIIQRIKTCHQEVQISDFVLRSLILRQNLSNMSFEDDTDESMPSASQVLKPLRQRMYGIMLPQESSLASETFSGSADSGAVNSDFGTVEEIYAHAGYSMDHPEIVKGMPLDFSPQPRLENLWSRSVDASTKRLRLQAFFSIMHCSHLWTEGIVDSVADHYILLCCILHFLLLEAPPSTLRSCDVDAFVSQAVCLQGNHPQSLAKLKVPRVSPRAVHMATIFMRGVSHGCAANSVCCLPFKMDALLPWGFFDGKLFHVKYLAAEEGHTLEQLCDHMPRAVDVCKNLRRWIVMGTRLDAAVDAGAEERP